MPFNNSLSNIAPINENRNKLYRQESQCYHD